MKPPINPVTATTNHTWTWYGAGASWNSVSIPTASDKSPDNVNAPCVTTCASITSNTIPSTISAIPAQLVGSTEKPNNAVTRQTPPSAPGSTTPGWKIS